MRHAVWKTRRAANSIVTMRALALPFVLLVQGGPLAAAAVVPTGFKETVYVNGLNSPTAMAFAPDGRLLVCEKDGQLRVIKNGVLLGTPFVSVSVSAQGERGLLGVALDPAFDANGYVYLYYSAADPRENRVSRFVASSGDPDVAEPGETVILSGIPSDNTRHQGGAIHFGVDQKLYIGIGDDTVPSNSQSLGTLSGKLLRIDPSGFPGNLVPSDNPFLAVPGAREEIWALGLRNPFSFAVQPVTGTILINDVGASSFEEINLGIPGANYGWPDCEGPCSPSNPDFQDPLYFYPWGGGAAITGGVFYPADRLPQEYQGNYFFGDFVQSFIRRLRPDGLAVGFASGVNGIVDLDAGSDGDLYYLSETTGTVGRISYALLLSTSVNQAAFSPGEQLVASVQAENAGSAGAVDFYFGALLPDGNTVVFFTNLAFDAGVGELSDLRSLSPIVAGVDLSSPFAVDQPGFFTYPWQGDEPAGIYTLFLAAVIPGAFTDGSLDPGDLVGLATAPFAFTP